MTDEVNTSAVIVAVPADADPIHAASSEDLAHMTMIWMGNSADLTPEQVGLIDSELRAYSRGLSERITEQVSGHATLGAEGAQVLLMDASAFADIRAGMIEDPQSAIAFAHDAVKQHPVWIPHVTLGYPDNPAAGEFAADSITFDRLEFWNGDDHISYPFGGGSDEELPEPAPAHPEDEDEIPEGFNQHSTTTITAAISEAIERPIDTEALTGEYSPAEPDEDEVDEDDDDIEAHVEIPFHGIAAPIGVVSGDKRMFADGAIRFRQFPLPLLYQRADIGPHLGSVRVGRIDEMWVDDENMVRYRGFFNSTPEVDEVITGIVDGSIRGVSVDVDENEMIKPEVSDATTIDEVVAAMFEQDVAVFSDARIAGLTIVAIPAFQEVYLALGSEDCTECAESEDDEIPEVDDAELDEELALVASAARFMEGGVIKSTTPGETVFDRMVFNKGEIILPFSQLTQTLGLEPEEIVALAKFAPGTKDGPGWITDPVPTARLRRYWTKGKGAAKIKWGVPGDFNRCRRQLAKYITNPDWLAGACANMHREAIGVWPGQEGGGRGRHALEASAGEMSPSVSLVASVGTLPREWFENPRLTGPTPLTITDDGQIYGHLATWGTCHIGFPGVCTTPPTSRTNYAYFTTGVVDTDGGPVPVGQITMDTGHAGPRGTLRKSLAHYDHTGTAVADIAAGEDGYGIWVAGALRKNVSEEKIAELKAAALSGDWRESNGSLEMIAALAVNVPGFPIPRAPRFAASGDKQISLVASGIVPSVATPLKTSLSVDDMVGMVAAVADELEFREERKAKLAKIQPHKQALRAARIARVREFAATTEQDES